MSKRLILVLALAFVVGLSVAAYAEVQNVKVSGDLLFRAVDRRNFTLSKTNDLGGDSLKYKVAGFTMAARVRIDADLTDNVSTVVRLLNERHWGEEFGFVSDSEIGIDLAYVTLKEFLYSPLTLTVGRQELRFGNAMIIGDPDTNRLDAAGLVPPDLSLRKSFDAIRATLNYDPLVVDVIYSKIAENDVWYAELGGDGETRDTNLWGVNAKYDLSGLGITGTGELYYFSRTARSAIDILDKKDTSHTVGLLVGGKIIENLSGSLEYAYQFGNVFADTIGVNFENVNLERRAWALQANLNYALPTMRMSPNLGLTYSYFSGDKTNNDRYSFWDPMYEDQTPNTIPNALFLMTNCMAVNAKASITPMEDISLTGVYGYYRLNTQMDTANGIPSAYADQATSFYPMTDNKSLGHALDLIATYDYTEDVQLGLTFGYFNPGAALDKVDAVGGFHHDATQLIGSMKVTF